MAEKRHEQSGFKVTDRRLFTSEGELRAEVAEEVEAPKTPAPTAVPPSPATTTVPASPVEQIPAPTAVEPVKNLVEHGEKV